MNKNISEEVIDIGGKEYTLFLNRTGLVAWEKATDLSKKSQEYKKYSLSNEEVVLNDDSNPFEMFEDLDNEIEQINDMYAKFYWIVLYTHHQFSQTEARKLFYTAIEEYGIDQLALLAQQMIEDINTDKITKNLKNLKALRPTK